MTPGFPSHHLALGSAKTLRPDTSLLLGERVVSKAASWGSNPQARASLKIRDAFVSSGMAILLHWIGASVPNMVSNITPLSLYGGFSSRAASSGMLCPHIRQRPHQQFNRT